MVHNCIQPKQSTPPSQSPSATLSRDRHTCMRAHTHKIHNHSHGLLCHCNPHPNDQTPPRLLTDPIALKHTYVCLYLARCCQRATPRSVILHATLSVRTSIDNLRSVESIVSPRPGLLYCRSVAIFPGKIIMATKLHGAIRSVSQKH